MEKITKNFIKKFRYPLLGSLLVVAITSVYLNFTLVRISTTDFAYLTLMNKIQANLNRMYINNNPYFIDANVVDHESVFDVIKNPFFRSGMANTLYWNVFFKRAIWLDNYCGGYASRIANCGPTKKCSCLTNPSATFWLGLDYYHMFTASDLYAYKTGNIAGCTGQARVFMDLAQKFPLNTSIHYVTTVKYESNGVTPDPADVYIHACPQQGVKWSDYNVKMNGHQVVAIQMPNGNWRILNTSSPQISWARNASTNAIIETSLANLVSNSNRRIDIIFPGMPNDSAIEVYTVTAIGVDDVYTHRKLMNKYASGNINDSYCKWPAW